MNMPLFLYGGGRVEVTHCEGRGHTAPAETPQPPFEILQVVNITVEDECYNLLL